MMNYRNPVFTTDGYIDCEIRHPTYGWIPFTVNPTDAGAQFNVAELDRKIRAAGNIAPYVPPPPPTFTREQLRDERDFLLRTIVDPIVTNPLRWADLSESQRQEIVDYRRSLLDITDQPGFPEKVIWPPKPKV
jgi:hypothetical protein